MARLCRPICPVLLMWIGPAICSCKALLLSAYGQDCDSPTSSTRLMPACKQSLRDSRLEHAALVLCGGYVNRLPWLQVCMQEASCMPWSYCDADPMVPSRRAASANEPLHAAPDMLGRWQHCLSTLFQPRMNAHNIKAQLQQV